MNTTPVTKQFLKNCSVLVVDDYFIHAEHFSFVLTDAGWNVKEFECDPDRILIRMEEDIPEIVLLDICFPGGVRGFELLEKMRDFVDKRDLPSPFVVFLTGDGDAATRSEATATPGAIYREKPISDEALVATFEEAAQRLPQWRAFIEAERFQARWSEELNEERIRLIVKELQKELSFHERQRLRILQELQARWLEKHAPIDTTHAEAILEELKRLPDHGILGKEDNHAGR